ncbi:MAG: MFS transporter, partial [Candidatus Micrarchaeaceae archaeon]
MKTRPASYYRSLKSIHFVSAIVFLWGLSDALVSFYLPIQMQLFLHNLTLFGILFAVSSLAGAFADPILGFLSSRFRYLAFLVAGLLLSAVVVVTANISPSIPLIIWLMAAWGFYYEFINIGIFNYVGRYRSGQEQSRSFGIIYLFMNLAYVIGPLVGGYLVLYGNRIIYGLCFVFVALAFSLIPRIVAIHRRKEVPIIEYKAPTRYSIMKQLRSYRKVWAYASVFFVAAFLYNAWDSFVWTLIPLESIKGSAIFAGIITSAFTIPLALFEGYGGKIADTLGRNITFVAGLLAASVC